jgi:hypothetical protein
MKRESFEITDRASWAQMRRGDLTASRIAALFEQHPFLSRRALAEQLRGVTRRIDTYSMRCGRILEPGVAVALSEARPEWKLTKATSYHRLPELRIGGTPDYFVGDDGLVQIGTISPAEWQEEPPLYKIIQTHCELLVTGRRYGWLAIMLREFPELPLHVFEVPHDAAAEEAILDAAAAWWHAWDEDGAIPPAAKLEIVTGGWHRAPKSWAPPSAPRRPPEGRTPMADLAAMFGVAAQRGWP